MPFKIKKGTNISHWLSQSKERGKERKEQFTRDDCKRLADLGLDHLRLPVDEEQMWDEENEREPEAWDLLNQGLDWCEEDGMKAIVDLHILRCHYFNAGKGENTLFTDPASAAHFGDCWCDLQKGLRSRSIDQVAYELMNEPVADDSQDWNRVFRVPYEALRREETDRIIGIGSNCFNSITTYDDFDPPVDDPNIILVFHYYRPMLITHYAAPWCRSIKDYHGPIRYPGRPVPEEGFEGLDPELYKTIEGMNDHYDIDVMESDFEPVLRKMKETGLPLWCNEFGVYNQVEDDIRKAWYRDFITLLDKYDIAWSNWDFRGGFGLYDKDNNETVVIKALLG